MRKIKCISLIILSAVIAGGCHKKQEQEEITLPQPQDILFEKTLKLIALYADSLKNAPDSISIDDMFVRFNSKLDSLNFDVIPDTDLEYSEGQNDTLYNSLMKLRELFNIKKENSQRIESEEDTVGVNLTEKNIDDRNQ